MGKWTPKSKFLRFVYQQTVVRFTGQVREPYLIRIDRIFTHPDTNELTIAFHIANKRVNQETSVADFVKSDMIYLIDPRVVFDIGQQFGAHSEQLTVLEKKSPSLKAKCFTGLKRVFVDE
ncbi:hypothetical protein [Legionella spiritensis]|uniref:Uncharacterized protein n=1 Tax=Legionella spiritensis TaxID=452 RepID=A0A0W0YZ34_LEGSP|nr:hypothetical protein [Legionella spiritensis]KTD62148.1 hypothetical protein Lspi_1998 [Legionella spiritensis]SNV29576.1 Uncharacterised protein [Legionella spiritensis]